MEHSIQNLTEVVPSLSGSPENPTVTSVKMPAQRGNGASVRTEGGEKVPKREQIRFLVER